MSRCDAPLGAAVRGMVLFGATVLAGVLAHQGLSGAAQASASCASTTTLSGTLAGEDHRFVKAQLGFELRAAAGTSVGPDGCATSGGGYQITHTINPHLDAEGTNAGGGSTTAWSVTVPTNAVNINIEVYPKAAGTHGPTDHTRYGNARIQGTTAGASGVAVVLPLNCGLADNGVTGTNGSITVAVTRDGQVVAPYRASAFSIDASGFPRGFGIARAAPPGVPSEILALASGQRYRMFFRLTSSSPTQTFDLDVAPCSATVWTLVLGKFQDVPWGHRFFEPITWMLDEGLSDGWPDDTFRPTQPVSRQMVAAWVWRRSGEPSAPSSTFSDIGPSHPFRQAIAWMEHTGRSTGFPDGTYRPGACATRGALAAFLYREAGEPSASIPDPTSFTDVGSTHPFAAEIEWLAGTGVTDGFADGTFRPGACITRQAAAAMLQRFYS